MLYEPKTIRGRLLLLVAVTALPLILLAVGLVIWQSRTHEDLLSSQAAAAANSAMQSVDRELSGAITGLQVLAASPAIRQGDLAGFHAQAKAAVGIAGNSVIILYDRSGRRLVSTAAPYGQPLPRRQDMSALAEPFDTGQPSVSRLFMSETVRSPTLGIVVPVAADGVVRYVLGAGLLSDRLTGLLRQTGLPAPWIATLVDQHGTIIARTLRPETVVGRSAIQLNWDRIRGSASRTGSFEGVTQEGLPVTITFARSATSGWTTVVAIPIQAFEAPRREQLILVVLTGLSILGLALAIAYRVSSRLSRAADQLHAVARELEGAEAPPVRPSRIRLFDELADKMRLAGARLREREQRLRETVSELRGTHERLRTEESNKDQFIATLAHELRNPLAPIRTGLAVLGRNPPPDKAARTLAMMERQLTHIVRLIADLLDISRIKRDLLVLKQEDVAIQTVVAFAIDSSRAALAVAGVTLHDRLPPDPVWVHGDKDRLAQVVINVLDNSAKFTPAGGTVDLSVEAAVESVEIRIRDTGPGIPPSRLQAVFEMFNQVKDENNPGKPGLGIGLPLARRLVEMHGGTIEAVGGGTGQGAEIVIRLPRQAVAAPDERKVQAGRASTRQWQILVVDDNTDAADVLSESLRLAGHIVRTAYSGADALAVAAHFRADLALLDIGMPVMNGYELCGRLRALASYERCRIVAVTGWGSAEDRAKARLAGFDAHLTKPVDWAAIELVVADLDLSL